MRTILLVRSVTTLAIVACALSMAFKSPPGLADYKCVLNEDCSDASAACWASSLTCTVCTGSSTNDLCQRTDNGETCPWNGNNQQCGEIQTGTCSFAGTCTGLTTTPNSTCQVPMC